MYCDLIKPCLTDFVVDAPYGLNIVLNYLVQNFFDWTIPLGCRSRIADVLMNSGLQTVLSTIVTLLAIGSAAYGQDLPPKQINLSVSMNDAQEIALRQNRDVIRASLEVRKTEAILKAILTTRYPKLLALSFTGQSVVAPRDWNFVALPAVLQPLTQQYRLDLQVREATLTVQVAQQRLRRTKQQTVAEVKRAYLSMLALQSAIASLEQNLAFLNELQRYVECEVKKGAALPVDLLLVQARFARADFELARAKDDLNTMGQSLNRQLGRPPKTELVLTEEPIAPFKELNQQATIAEALAKRPELTEVKLDVNRANLLSKIQLSGYIPDISFGVAGAFSSNFSPPFPRTFTAIGFAGVWEPWDWGRRIQLSKEANREMQQNKVQLLDLTDSVSIDADKARRAMWVAEKEVRAGALAEASTQEQLRVVNRRLQVGAALLKDVLEAEAAYTLAITENVKAKTDAAAARVGLDEALGRDF
jgi:outer membrane protein